MKRGLALFVAAAFLPGCASDGGDDPTATESSQPAAETAVFESDRLAFTFEYPDELVVDRPRPPVLARVAVERAGRLNAIQVRRTARRELRPARYLDEFRRDLEGAVERVRTREDQIAGREAGVLEVEGKDFNSSSYFFTGAGQTWQLECLSDDEHRARIDDACRIALDSIAFGD